MRYGVKGLRVCLDICLQGLRNTITSYVSRGSTSRKYLSEVLAVCVAFYKHETQKIFMVAMRQLE